MRQLFISLLALLWSSVGGAHSEQSCAALWDRLGPLEQADEPVWVDPNVPSEGVWEDIRMYSLRYPDGAPFIPRDIEESNCFLDRILDVGTQQAIVASAREVAMHRRAGKSEQLDLFLESLLTHTDDRALTILGNLWTLYGLRPGPDPDAGPFMKYAYGQGLYNGHSIKLYILVAYAHFKGVKTLSPRAFLKFLRAEDASYAPPRTNKASGCPEGIDYRWPHVGSSYDMEEKIPETDVVHYGLCRSTQTVWSYHYRFGWHRLSEPDQQRFCKYSSYKPFFSAVCASTKAGDR